MIDSYHNEMKTENKPEGFNFLGNSKFKVDSWDLSWYECFLAFESKKREMEMPIKEFEESLKRSAKMVEKEENLEAKNIIVPVDILKQLAAVKCQLTEFQMLLELNEELQNENQKLEECIEEIEQINYFQTKENANRFRDQEQRLEKMESQVKQLEQKNHSLKQKISTSRKIGEKRKRERQANITELAMLRQINKYSIPTPKDDGGRRKFRSSFSVVETSKVKTNILFNSVSGVIKEDQQEKEKQLDSDEVSVDDESISLASMCSLKHHTKNTLHSFSLKGLRNKSKGVFKVLRNFAEEGDFNIDGHSSAAW